MSDADLPVAELLAEARGVRTRAYAPYSGYQVGACVLAKDGRRFVGVNVENSSYPLSMCAERNAVATAVAQGAGELVAVAIVTPLDKDGKPGSPCGGCRQVLHEHGVETVLLAGPTGDAEEVSLSSLLPRAFGRENLR